MSNFKSNHLVHDRYKFKSNQKKISPKLLQLYVPSLLSGIKKLNKLILAKSKKFTQAVSSHFRFVLSGDINHSHQWQGQDMNLSYW